MDLKNICIEIFSKIYNSSKEKAAPVAEVTLRVGKDWNFSDYEMTECFNKEKWNSSLSNADLTIVHDENLDCLYKIEKISEFVDL